jgi:SNF family Na+-dependent transporter
MTNGNRPKEEWASRLGLIMAVAGSAVGLGNFLRFPGQAAANGGGTFMIPYFCALLFLGIPICWAEWTMGKYGGQFGFNSCPAIFAVLGRRPVWRYLGVLGLLVPVVIYMYYVLIESWCLGYAWYYLAGWIDFGPDASLWPQRSAEFFDDFVGSKSDGFMLDGKLRASIVFWAITLTANFVLIYRGISKGIEKFCTWAMPVMALCAAIVLVRVLTLGTPDPSLPDQNVLNGLGFMWNPKPAHEGESWFSALVKPEVWMAAAGQIFFTLGVGFGIIINYASYLKRKDDIVLSGLTASATNEFFEVCLGGLITIPAAFIFLGGSQAGGSLYDLGFKTLPVVFQHMPAGGIFGFLWFLMLFLAAITSSLSMLQPGIAFLEEGLNVGRRVSVTILGLITALGSLFVIYYSKDRVALDTMDDWVGTALMVLLATVEVLLFSWFFGAKKGEAFANEGAQMRLPRFFRFVIRYVAPLYLLIVLGTWCCRVLPDKLLQLGKNQVALLTMCIIGSVLIFFLLLTNIAGKRWNAEDQDTSPPSVLPRSGEVKP